MPYSAQTQSILLPCLLLLLIAVNGAYAVDSEKAEKDHIEKKFRELDWLDWRQAVDAYWQEYQAAELLGKNTQRNPDRMKIYPENRVVANQTIVVFCLLTPDKVLGYRTNSIYLVIWEEGYIQRRSLLAPKKKIISPAEQLNCWNYAQESVCHPVRDCKNPGKDRLHVVGFVTMEGWGIFQLKARPKAQAHFQCISDMQNILQPEERGKDEEQEVRKEYIDKASDVEQLKIYTADIGEPQLHMLPGYTRGQPLSINCSVNNSSPIGSTFAIDLVLLRPPPPGVPGANRHELLASHVVKSSQAMGTLRWKGELALMTHHGLNVNCMLRRDWGLRKGKRLAYGQINVLYMYPVFLDNPRIRSQLVQQRVSSRGNVYLSPEKIKLRQAEYVVCKADGFPASKIKWSTNAVVGVWILNETLFISNELYAGDTLTATCRADNEALNLTSTINVTIEVTLPAPRAVASAAAVLITLAFAMAQVLLL